MTEGILTRTEAASVTKLTTLARFKAELQETTTTNDTLYGQVIDYCSAAICSYLKPKADEMGGRTLGREAVSEAFYFDNVANYLILGRRPIGDLISVTEGGTTVPRLIDGAANPAFVYVPNKASGVVRRVGGVTAITPFARGLVTVAYTAGWLLPGQENRNLPFDIEDACLRFCHLKLNQINEGGDLTGSLTGVSIEGVGNFQFGNGANNRGRALPYAVTDLLDPYRNMISV